MNCIRLALAMVVLSSCSSLPSDYTQPQINVPSELKDSNNDVNLDRLPYLAWWNKFNDPTLNQLIDNALINNNDVVIATQNIAIAQAQLDTIKLSWIPGINFLAGFSQNPALGNPGVFYGLQPAYITNLFNTYYQQQQATYNLQRTETLKLGVRLAVIGEVTAGYFSLLAWQDRLNILQQKLQNYQQLINITNRAKGFGLSNDLQISSLQNQIEQIKGEISNVETNIVTSENVIRYLINQAPGKINTKKAFNHINGEIIVFKKINVKVIANRPDVMAAFQSIEAAGSGIDVSISQLLPSINLSEFVGMSSQNGAVSSPNQGASFANIYASANLSPATFGNINASKAAFRLEVAKYNKTIQNALKEVANSIDANDKLTAKYDDNRKALQAVIENDNLQQDKYNQGLINQLTLINSHIGVNDSELVLNTSKLEQLISVVKLYQDLAGGYDIAKSR